MRRKLLFLGVAIFVIVAVGWQFGAAYLANVELHEDVKDVASQNSVNIGLNAPRTDQQIRLELIKEAAADGVQLGMDQIALKKYVNESTHRVWYDVTVDYTVPINLLVFSYNLHFVQSSKNPTPFNVTARDPD